MHIKVYEITSPFVTAGSGNARWCIAEKDHKQYFLKQFLAPVQPVQTTVQPSPYVVKRRERCADFERRKRRLYNALGTIDAPCVVRVEDFFVHEGHYYTASEYIDPSHQTFETVHAMSRATINRLVQQLAGCLESLHQSGIVHADLKPEHIIIREYPTQAVQLIDFDSGFLASSPPAPGDHIEIDPVYLSPEAYLLMTGRRIRLTPKLDVFSLGIVLHQALTGELPRFDRAKYSYLYACVLDRGSIELSPNLTAEQHTLIRKMLRKNPAFRPGDDAIRKALRAAAAQDA